MLGTTLKRLAVALCVFTFSVAAHAAKLDETFDKTYEVKPGTAFSLDNVNGHVTIGSWDQPRVRIHAVKHVEANGDDAAKKAMGALRIEVGQNANSLTLKTRSPKEENGGWSFFDLFTSDRVQYQVTYEVTVPRTMNVDASTVNGGVDLAGVTGSHRVETTNGRVEVTGCSGQLRAETTNGRIHAQLLKIAPNGSLRLETTNGGITVEVPRGFAGNVEAETTNGGISSDIPVATTRTARNELHGTINGGGSSSLHLSTTNGGITIKAQ
jgi:DUF4097 and DUF4098 domain-containing protein YvlB